MNPATFPFWLAGMFYYLFSCQGKPYRLFGWTYLVVLAMLLLDRSSRPDRILAVYPMLFAAGGLIVGQFLQRFHLWLLLQTAILENSLPIYVCRRAKFSLNDVWSEIGGIGPWKRNFADDIPN